MKWYWQIIILLSLGTVLFLLTTIVKFLKYHLGWSFRREWVRFTLNKIWTRAGIVEIRGGAETGKTLLIILLAAHLEGRKWSNIPNTIPGHQELSLSVLKEHWIGDYKNGLVGVNNVLLIDEAWNFFSQKNLHQNHMSNLGSLLSFLSETSKTNFKIFYVTKQGAQLPQAFNILSENKSASIRTLGIRHYTRYWGKDYYYLDIEFTTPKDKSSNTFTKKPKKVKYQIDGDHRIRKSKVGWFWQRWFGGNNIISIPFSQEDLRLFDKTWNLDSDYARQRMISIFDKTAMDTLIETLRYKRSRTQKLQEENEILTWWKRHPDPARRTQMMVRGWGIAKSRGLWKSAATRIEEEQQELKKPLH